MAKPTRSQAAFSFLEEVEKTEPAPKPAKNILRPPTQIELNIEETLIPQTTEDQVPEIVEITEIENQEGPGISVIEPVAEAIENIVQGVKTEEVKTTPIKSAGTRGRKSIKWSSTQAEEIQIPDDEELFKKQYYSMGEVTTMFKENHSLIRYWESEFDILTPKKNGKGDRFFRPADVKNLYLIYDLLRRKKFTIEGAREYLKNNKTAQEKFVAVQSLEKIKTFFLELKATL